MRKILGGALGIATLMLPFSSGCALSLAEQSYWAQRWDRTLWQDTNSSQSAADRMHTQRQVVNQDARALVEDIDFILMRERPSRLSRWHNR